MRELPPLHGAGFALSSLRTALAVAERLCREERRLFLSAELVAQRALEDERAESGLPIAGQDVATIVHGGVCEIFTGADGRINVCPIEHNPLWIARHTIVALDPNGERHSAPTLLRGLLTHPLAKEFVRRISATGTQAAQAIRSQDVAALADAVNRYRGLFNEWARGRYVTPTVQAVAEQLQGLLGDRQLGWKPPGAGGASALLVVADDAGKVLEFFDSLGWYAWPAQVTHGLECDGSAAPEAVRISAGLRIDYIGAADLGSAKEINEPGICVAFAIQPRIEKIFRVGDGPWPPSPPTWPAGSEPRQG
jgi:hypothetical protein